MIVSPTKRRLPDTVRVLFLVFFAFVLTACPGRSSGRTSETEPAQEKPAAEAPGQATAAPSATLTDTPNPAPFAQVTTSALNVRSGPGTAYDKIGVVFESDRLEVLGQAFECAWLLILTPSGLEGWVSGAYVDLGWPCRDLVAAAIPATPTTGPTATLAQADTPTPTRPPETPSPTLASADTPTPTPPPTATLANADTPTPTPSPAPAFTSTPTGTPTPTLASPDTPTPTRPVEPTEAPAEPAVQEPGTLNIQPLRPGDLQLQPVPVPMGTLSLPQ